MNVKVEKHCVKKTLLTALFLLTGMLSLRAQEQAAHPFGHSHQRNEFGLSLGGAYEIQHREWAPFIHIHYFRTFTPHSRWAWGAGFELIPNGERHVELGAGVRFEPVRHLQLTLMPGVSVTDRARFSVHAEVVWEAIQVGILHLGPVVGYAWTRDHSHVSVGIHAAVAFGAGDAKKR